MKDWKSKYSSSTKFNQFKCAFIKGFEQMFYQRLTRMIVLMQISLE